MLHGQNGEESCKTDLWRLSSLTEYICEKPKKWVGGAFSASQRNIVVVLIQAPGLHCSLKHAALNAASVEEAQNRIHTDIGQPNPSRLELLDCCLRKTKAIKQRMCRSTGLSGVRLGYELKSARLALISSERKDLGPGKTHTFTPVWWPMFRLSNDGVSMLSAAATIPSEHKKAATTVMMNLLLEDAVHLHVGIIPINRRDQLIETKRPDPRDRSMQKLAGIVGQIVQRATPFSVALGC